MKIKVNKTIQKEIEIEIDFPAYHRFGNAHMKTTSGIEYIMVSMYSGSVVSIEKRRGFNQLGGSAEWEQCTEQEFNEAYDKALRILFHNRPYGKVNLEQSFSDFKKTLDVSIPKGPEDYDEIPTIDRYDTIPLNSLDTRYGTKEVNQFIP